MDSTKKASRKTTFIAAAAGVIALGAAGFAATAGWDGTAQETDDAYVSADFTLVAPRVSGTVTEVLVEDNQEVKTGEVLARIDDRDFQAALHVAQAELKACQSRLSGIDARAARQQAVIGQAAATISSDDAALQFARQNAGRYSRLSEAGAGTTEQQQQSEFGLRQQLAAHQRDSAAQSAAEKELAVLASERLEALAAIGRAEALLEQAELKVSYATVKAPATGVVGRRAVRVGGYVSAGASLMAVVPLHSVYIVGNFRETQLTHMRRGQPVSVVVDAFPGLRLKGSVDSLAPATGLTFSPLAPDNATGNFTKVAQRLPVRIRLDPGQAGVARLRVGMSVVPTIETAAAARVNG